MLQIKMELPSSRGLCEVLHVLVGLLWVLSSHGVTCKPLQSSDCTAQGLAKYSLTLDAYWSRDVFNKQYPLYRPNAQWSKLVGRTHNGDYSMWSVGHVTNDAVKEFVETSVSTLLDQEIQGFNGILDAFNTMHIPQGVGSAAADFLVDTNHPKISALARIVPSPDWFVGIDSVSLCQGQTWLPEVTIDLDPLDAGTDQGFTFTSPNWPEDPRKPIAQITSSFPRHPASSFYYPERSQLPTIARITIKRLELISDAEAYEESSGNGYANDDARVGTNFLEKEQLAESRRRPKLEEKPVVADRENVVSVPVGAKLPAQSPPTKATKASKKSAKELKEKRRRKKNRERKRKEKLRLKKLKEEKLSVRLDCIQSEWSEWSACSKTCGYGTQTRRRSALQEEQNGGIPCDTAAEDQMCGSMKSCNWNHFSFSNWGAGI